VINVENTQGTDVAGSKMVQDGARWCKMVQDVYVFVFPFFFQTLVTLIGVVGCIEAMCVDWKTMRRPSENGRSHQMPSVTESVDDVEMLCLWMFMVFMVSDV
jgi:hypothetical protein